METDNDIDSDQENDSEEIFSTIKPILFLAGISLVAIFSPPISIFVATFRGITELSMFNASMLFLLSMLVIIFILVKSITHFNDHQPRVFIVGLVFVILSIITFIGYLLAFMNL